MNPDILERLERLETRSKRLEKIMREIGEKMSEDFDFDSLLDDVTENEEKGIATEKAKEKPVKSTDEISQELDDLLDNLDAPVEEVQEVVTEPEVQEVQEVPETKATPAPTSLEPEVQEATYENTGVEFAEETKAYARAFLDLEMRKKALQQEARDLKDEFSEQGVDTAAVNKAMKAIAKEIKQTAEEAAAVESVKEMFKNDPAIYTNIVGLTE